MEHQAVKIHAGKYEYRGHTIEKFISRGIGLWKIQTPFEMSDETASKYGWEYLTQPTIADAKNWIDYIIKENRKEEN